MPAILGSAVVLVAVGAVWYLKSMSPTSANTENPAQVAAGKGVYRDNCAVCHGANLEGQPNWRERKPDDRLPAPPHDETGHTWHHPDEHLFRITKFGLKPPLAPVGYETDMPSFEGSLSDEEIWATLAFIKSTWPPQIRERHNILSGRQIKK